MFDIIDGDGKVCWIERKSEEKDCVIASKLYAHAVATLPLLEAVTPQL